MSAQATTIEREPGGQGLAVVAGALPRGQLALVTVLSVLGSMSEGLGLVLLVPILHLIGTDGSADAGPTGTIGRLWRAYGALGLPTSLGGMLLLFVALVMFRAALVQWRSQAEQVLEARTTDALRTRLLRALVEADWAWLAGQRQSDLLAMLVKTIDRVSIALQQAQTLAAVLVTLAAMLVAALLIDPLPAAAIGIGGLFVLALHLVLRRGAERDGEAMGERYSRYFAFFVERIAALRLIKSFGAEEREVARGRQVMADLRQVERQYMLGMGTGQFALQSGTAAVLAVVVWLALQRWHSSPATLLPLIAVSARSAPLLGAVQQGFHAVAHHWPALAELGNLTATAEAHGEGGAHQMDLLSPATAIRLDRVAVRHEGRTQPALDGVSADFPVGSTTLLSGPSGAGKSTLADVLAGLVTPGTGSLQIDGTALDRQALRAWRRHVAYVQQEPVLFDATIRENLLWAAPEASEERLRACLEAASASFVLDLPEGLDTVVGDRGARLSGGERQRIALARGLLRSPALLILDEVTSALDAENEAAVTRAIERLAGSLTLVIIGHRGALSQLADRVLHLENGALVTSGDTAKLDSLTFDRT